MAEGLKRLDDTKCREVGRDCACYNLRRAARAVSRFYDDFLRPSGLKTTQYSVLMAARSRGPLALTKLAELTVTERTTLTRNLTILEKKGFILIEPGVDRRERQVSITERGLEALMAAIPFWEEAQAHIENGLGENKMRKLIEGLSELTAMIRGR